MLEAVRTQPPTQMMWTMKEWVKWRWYILRTQQSMT